MSWYAKNCVFWKITPKPIIEDYKVNCLRLEHRTLVEQAGAAKRAHSLCLNKEAGLRSPALLTSIEVDQVSTFMLVSWEADEIDELAPCKRFYCVHASEKINHPARFLPASCEHYNATSTLACVPTSAAHASLLASCDPSKKLSYIRPGW